MSFEYCLKRIFDYKSLFLVKINNLPFLKLILFYPKHDHVIRTHYNTSEYMLQTKLWTPVLFSYPETKFGNIVEK